MVSQRRARRLFPATDLNADDVAFQRLGDREHVLLRLLVDVVLSKRRQDVIERGLVLGLANVHASMRVGHAAPRTPRRAAALWSKGAPYNLGIETALRFRHGLLRPDGDLAFTDAV